METATDRECVLELYWQQRAPGEWTAVVIDRKTGARREARSVAELRAALKAAVRQRPKTARYRRAERARAMEDAHSGEKPLSEGCVIDARRHRDGP